MLKITNDQATIIAGLASTGPIAVYEYRGEKIDKIDYLDKSTGKPAQMVRQTVAAESPESGDQVPLEVYSPRGTDPTLTGLRKGELFVACLTAYLVDKGKPGARMKQWQRLTPREGEGIPAPETGGAADGKTAYQLKDKAKA